MDKEPKRIKLANDVALLLQDAEAEGTPVEIDVNGKTYDLVPRTAPRLEGDIWRGYDPEKVRMTVSAYAGTVSEAEADQLIANIYRAREEGSRPAERPR